jgi:hypothetical protein
MQNKWIAGNNFNLSARSGQNRCVNTGKPTAKMSAKIKCAREDALFSAIHTEKITTDNAGRGISRLMV